MGNILIHFESSNQVEHTFWDFISMQHYFETEWNLQKCFQIGQKNKNESKNWPRLFCLIFFDILINLKTPSNIILPLPELMSQKSEGSHNCKIQALFLKVSRSRNKIVEP